MTNREKMLKYREAAKKYEVLALNTVKSDPWVAINLGGKEYRLEFSYGATIEIFRQTGIAIGYEPVDVKVLMTPEILGLVLLAGLKTHHADAFADETQIMNLVPIRHLNYIAGVLGAALRAVEPDPEEMADITESLEDLEDKQIPLALNGTTQSSGLSAGNSVYPTPKLVE